jgi:GNAT superfamily N-acetyltransferase
VIHSPVGGHDVVEVRALAPDEWGRLKAIRLEALADSPLAYTTTLDEASRFPDSVWQERASGSAHGLEQITMIGVDGRKTVAMGVGLLRRNRRHSLVAIVSVYVSPEYRRSGTGGAVMRGIEAWARRNGADATSLWVVDDNERARVFYESLGYRATLDRQRITVPPVRWETRFVKRLTD